MNLEQIKIKAQELLNEVEINEYKERIFPQNKTSELLSLMHEVRMFLEKLEGADSVEFARFNHLFLEIQGKDIIPVYLVERIVGYLLSLKENLA